MGAGVNVSYMGLVRNVIGCGQEDIEVMPGTTVRDLLGMLIQKHGDSFRMSVFRESGELRSIVLVCVNDCDISRLEGLETKLSSGEKISVVVGVYAPEGG